MANCLPDSDIGPSAPLFDDSPLCILCRSQERMSKSFLCPTCEKLVYQCAEDMSSDGKSEIWECPRCTLFNNITNEQCEACGAPKVESVCLYSPHQ